MITRIIMAIAALIAVILLWPSGESAEFQQAFADFQKAAVNLQHARDLHPYIATAEEHDQYDEAVILMKTWACRRYADMGDRLQQRVDPSDVELACGGYLNEAALEYGPDYVERVMIRYMALEEKLRSRQQSNRRGDMVIASSGLFFAVK